MPSTSPFTNNPRIGGRGQLDGTELGLAGAVAVALAGDFAEAQLVSGVGGFVGAVGHDAVAAAVADAAAGELLHWCWSGWWLWW